MYCIHGDLVQYLGIEQKILSKIEKEVEAFIAARCQFVLENKQCFIEF